MKILSAKQIKEVDAYTIEQEAISSLDLMERASKTFVQWFSKKYALDQHEMLSIICGKGNNGADGLAIARLLLELDYDVAVFIIDLSNNSTAEFKENLSRLEAIEGHGIKHIQSVDELPVFAEDEILLDAILGVGLNRAVEGELEAIIHYLNECDNTTIAIDIPSGLFSDQATTHPAIRADYTFSFQAPKLAFLFGNNYPFVGEFIYRSIGLQDNDLAEKECINHYVTEKEVLKIYKKREKFAHKGVFGHALLIMGSYGKMGAAILATRACLRSGVGLATVHVPTCGYEVMQLAVPEAMVSLDEDKYIITRVYDLHKYTTIAVGCGLSTKNRTRNALCYMLKHMDKPTVLDADALNILGQSPDWMEYIPKNSILTPHPKEFERMFGSASNHFERYELQRQKAIELGVYIILKGANSCIATPQGQCYFNSTGNPGMGTAGSGDVLTGILSGLLAQEYTPLQACIFGVYLHGLAGDLAAKDKSEESLTAGDIVEYLGKAYALLSLKK